ncbi:integrase [Bacterioplanes sanyensis]|uniref:tyrosine-type recombinase/integrase n=1 Tax=Bacterioplanes sanyensis TaxID=1249553 RepID=UPI0016721DB8|nr:site-specific integrase [Bacterioplanes sanyensis]GGY41925.1 integrase [Bacterioplanes sanyensis]
MLSQVLQHPPTPLIDHLDHIDNPLNYARQVLQRLPELRDIEGAYDDLVHSLSFLVSYNGSIATFNSYRREVERLLQWSWQVQGLSLTELRRQHLEDFVRFCQAPPQAWIGRKQVARFHNQQGYRVANADWRPFVTQADKLTGEHPEQFALSQKSLQSIFSVLSTYFNYLLQEDYLELNPISLIRQKSKFIQRHAYKEPIRRISNMQWDYVLDSVNELAQENPHEHERSLFVMHCLYGMYLRISELVADERSTPTMGDFQCDSDGHWWLRVVGKGNKVRLVTVSDDMLASLQRYRLHLGLPALPTAGEQTPLVPKLRGRGPVTSTRQIRNLVQFCFDSAYQRMRAQGLEQDANELRVATVHWLRHTGISEDVRVRPKEHVKEDAGHASMATTDRYIDTELRERHASAKNKRLRPDYD